MGVQVKSPTPMGGRGGLVCPIDNCHRGKKNQHAMCPHHWAMVPDALQKGLWEAASGMKKGLFALGTVKRYNVALKACVDAIQGVQ